VYRQVTYSLLIQLRVNRVVNIRRLSFSSKIYADQLIKMNYLVNTTASVFIVNTKTLESRTFSSISV